ncbi:hypothetical protein JCM12107_09080 [Corynebacterium simulans]
MRLSLPIACVTLSLSLVACSAAGSKDEPLFDPNAASDSKEPEFNMVDLWSGEADKDTVEGAEGCADPFFDLGDTYAGYYLMQRKVGLDSPRGHSLGMGDDLGLVRAFPGPRRGGALLRG